MVVGTVSVTGLAYLDTTRKIENQQTQINELNAQIASFDETITSLKTSLDQLSGSIQGIEVIKALMALIIYEMAILVKCQKNAEQFKLKFTILTFFVL